MRISLETLLRMSLLLSSLLTGVMNCKLATAYEIAPSYRFKLKTPKLTPSQRRQAREDGENRFVQEQTSRAFVDQFTEARRQTRDALVAAYHAGEELAQTRSNAEHRMRVLVGAQDHHDDPTLFAGQPWEAALDLLSEGTVGDRLWLLEKFHATEGHSEKLDRRELAYLSARNLTPFDVQFGFPEMTARDFIGHVTHEEQALEALSELVAIPQSWLVASLYTHLRDIPLFRESREAGNTPPQPAEPLPQDRAEFYGRLFKKLGNADPKSLIAAINRFEQEISDLRTPTPTEVSRRARRGYAATQARRQADQLNGSAFEVLHPSLDEQESATHSLHSAQDLLSTVTSVLNETLPPFGSESKRPTLLGTRPGH